MFAWGAANDRFAPDPVLRAIGREGPLPVLSGLVRFRPIPAIRSCRSEGRFVATPSWHINAVGGGYIIKADAAVPEDRKSAEICNVLRLGDVWRLIRPELGHAHIMTGGLQ